MRRRGSRVVRCITEKSASRPQNPPIRASNVMERTGGRWYNAAAEGRMRASAQGQLIGWTGVMTWTCHSAPGTMIRDIPDRPGRISERKCLTASDGGTEVTTPTE